MFDKKTFGLRFGKALKERELSQTEAARMLGVPQSRISEYVRGIYTPPIERMAFMIQQLDLDVTILFPEWSSKVIEKTFSRN